MFVNSSLSMVTFKPDFIVRFYYKNVFFNINYIYNKYKKVLYKCQCQLIARRNIEKKICMERIMTSTAKVRSGIRCHFDIVLAHLDTSSS